jgi:hypothetical protein
MTLSARQRYGLGTACQTRSGKRRDGKNQKKRERKWIFFLLGAHYKNGLYYCAISFCLYWRLPSGGNTWFKLKHYEKSSHERHPFGQITALPSGKKSRPSKDMAKEGQIVHTVSWWGYGHCKVKVWNKDPSRLAFHLSGDVGLRNAGNGFTGIEVCLQVPSNGSDRAKIEKLGGPSNGFEARRLAH